MKPELNKNEKSIKNNEKKLKNIKKQIKKIQLNNKNKQNKILLNVELKKIYMYHFINKNLNLYNNESS